MRGVSIGIWLAAGLLSGSVVVGSAGAALTEPAGPDQTAEAVDPRLVVGEPKGKPLTGDALDKETVQTASLLRCPVCQGLSVADSPASMAVKMKAQVKELLAAGYDRSQILAYFENSYGEFVRLEPKARGVNWLVWLGPFLALLTGGGIVAWVLRRRPAPPLPVAGELPGRDTLPDDPRLRAAVLRVRETAYGWPGGREPEKEFR